MTIKTKRVTATIDQDLYAQLEYWAKRRSVSINEYLGDAIVKAIKFENKDYDLPTAEIARLNQIVDALTVNSANLKALEDVVIHGFDSILNITKGDNYLLEYEDGDIE
jgi:hypothetical protein